MAATGLGLLEQLLPFIVWVPLVLAAVTLLPITISDWGTRESAALLLLAPTGLEPEAIVSVSIIYGLFYLLVTLPGGLLLLGKKAKPSPHRAPGRATPKIHSQTNDGKPHKNGGHGLPAD